MTKDTKKKGERIDKAVTRLEKSIAHLTHIVAVGFRSIDQRFRGVDAKFDAVDQRFDIQSQEILALREDVDVIKGTMATKDDIHDVRLSIEHLTTTVQRIDQDNYALKAWLKRHDINLGSQWIAFYNKVRIL